MKSLFAGIYKDKTVLVTGHTGFKGSWLIKWLSLMGARVVGYSLPPASVPNHYEELNLNIISIIADINDINKLEQTIKNYNPDIVFHLAAQALVRTSYENPIETYETNVLGTLKVFEVCRKNNIKTIVNITSDKAYENNEWVWGYRENDRLGGYDPYSSSKACSEILTTSYRNSYFNIKNYKKTHNTLIASCRAGNVIGGGDWSEDRLLSDIIKAIVKKEKVIIRNPKAIRPWQHVLEPLSGYLMLGQKLLEEKSEFSEAWNFGPNDEKNITVEDLVKNIKVYWSEIDYEININANNPHESNLLKLDCTKAYSILKWKNVWDTKETLEKTINWYKSYYKDDKKILTLEDLEQYVFDAKIKSLEWTM